MSVKFSDKHLRGFVSEHEFSAIEPQVKAAHQLLEDKKGPENDFLGWLALPKE